MFDYIDGDQSRDKDVLEDNQKSNQDYGKVFENEQKDIIIRF